MKYLYYPEEMKYQKITDTQVSVMNALKKEGVNVLMASTLLNDYELDNDLYDRLSSKLDKINNKKNKKE